MKIDQSSYNITFRRGDSDTLTVRLRDSSFLSGDIVTLTVRDGAEGDILLQKNVSEFDEEGAAVFVFEPSDTDGLDFGKYVYDIQFTRGGEVVHIIPPKSESKLPAFRLTEEATY